MTCWRTIGRNSWSGMPSCTMLVCWCGLDVGVGAAGLHSDAKKTKFIKRAHEVWRLLNTLQLYTFVRKNGIYALFEEQFCARLSETWPKDRYFSPQLLWSQIGFLKYEKELLHSHSKRVCRKYCGKCKVFYWSTFATLEKHKHTHTSVRTRTHTSLGCEHGGSTMAVKPQMSKLHAQRHQLSNSLRLLESIILLWCSLTTLVLLYSEWTVPFQDALHGRSARSRRRRISHEPSHLVVVGSQVSRASSSSAQCLGVGERVHEVAVRDHVQTGQADAVKEHQTIRVRYSRLRIRCVWSMHGLWYRISRI